MNDRPPTKEADLICALGTKIFVPPITAMVVPSGSSVSNNPSMDETVGLCDAVETVATFDRGIGINEGGEEMFEIAVSRSIERRCDVLSLFAHFMAGEAGSESGFASFRVAWVFVDVGDEVVDFSLSLLALLGDPLADGADNVFGGRYLGERLAESFCSGEIERNRCNIFSIQQGQENLSAGF